MITRDSDRVAELASHCYWGGIGLPMQDNNGNQCLVFPTGFHAAETGNEIREWRLADGTGGYITSLYHNGDEPCWSWYGRGKRYVTLAQLLASLAAGGHIVPVETAEAAAT